MGSGVERGFVVVIRPTSCAETRSFLQGSRRLAAALIVTTAVAGCGPRPGPDPVRRPEPIAQTTTSRNERPAPPIAGPASDPTIKPATSTTPTTSLATTPTAAPIATPTPPTEETPPLRRKTTWTSSTENGVQRLREARAAKLDTVRQLFAAANVAFPPAAILLRAFKRDQRLEVWASGSKAAPLTHVTTYEICYASGGLGPKRMEGDRQVPEGFYNISYMNPWSKYFLSMQVSYPNASDLILGHKKSPGSEIMIHGNCASVGCISMMDERMQEIWVATDETRYKGGKIHVHIFPARDMAGLIASGKHPEHRAFWENIKEGHDLFARTKKIPEVSVKSDGRYAFKG